MAARDFQTAAVYPDSNSERLLDRPNVAIVLPQQLSEEAMVVEVEFERILVG
jgi:hypothetical protein